MVSILSFIQHHMDRPYKFIMVIAAVVFLSSFQSNTLGIDMSKARIGSLLILIFCVGAWVYATYTKSSLNWDVNYERFDDQEAELHYENTLTNLDILIFLGSIITIIVVLSN
jgi:Ca2+/Na+ antiporter